MHHCCHQPGGTVIGRRRRLVCAPHFPFGQCDIIISAPLYLASCIFSVTLLASISSPVSLHPRVPVSSPVCLFFVLRAVAGLQAGAMVAWVSRLPPDDTEIFFSSAYRVLGIRYYWLPTFSQGVQPPRVSNLNGLRSSMAYGQRLPQLPLHLHHIFWIVV